MKWLRKQTIPDLMTIALIVVVVVYFVAQIVRWAVS